MSKKQHRYGREPHSERSFYEQSFLKTRHYGLEELDLVNVIKGGEDTYLELKVRFTNTQKLVAEIVAMANTGGGAIIFGVNDNHRVEGIDDPEDIEEQLREICAYEIKPPVFPYIDKICFDNGRRILVLEVDSRAAPHYAFDYRYYIREGSRKREATVTELMQLYAKLRPTGFESVPLIGTTISDVDEAILWDYVRKCQAEDFKPCGYPTAEVMKEMGLAIDYGEQTVLTVAGLLLFGSVSSIKEKFPRSRLEAVRYSGSRGDIVEACTYYGNVVVLYELGLGFINRYCDLWSEGAVLRKVPSEGLALARGNYSEMAVREVLSNALVHRDYYRPEGIKLSVFDDRIELTNPVAGELSRKAIELYGLKQRPNPRIESVFEQYVCRGRRGGLLAARRVSKKIGSTLKLMKSREEFKVELSAA
ncbi:MAG: putative DNA binding domain-containing protein [Acidobacteriota bacterium]|nr:putative DNA binding domain-containing protein [Blastocatellia bacterium]MDW8411944.1 putative DNA binding domain-containing protein [Acidobacteriota bacterium]